jgi:hypothetical protein
MKTRESISGLIIAMIIFVACNGFPFGNRNRSLPNTFLIPADYEGVLRVVYEEKCGITPKVENGRQILEFKNDGLIVLNTTVDTGKDNIYYLVDRKGNRKTVTEIPDFREQTNKTPAIVVGPVSVSTQYITSVNSKITTSSGGAAYMDFKLYNKNNKEIRDEEFYQKLDSLTNAAVNACRASQLSGR